MLSSRGSFRPRDLTRVSCGSCTAGRFFTTESVGKAEKPLHFTLDSGTIAQPLPSCPWYKLTGHRWVSVNIQLKSLRRDYVAMFWGTERDQKVNHPLLEKGRHFWEQGWLSLDLKGGCMVRGIGNRRSHQEGRKRSYHRLRPLLCQAQVLFCCCAPWFSPPEWMGGPPQPYFIQRSSGAQRPAGGRPWSHVAVLGLKSRICVSALVMPCRDIWHYETECLPRGKWLLHPVPVPCVLLTSE